MSKIKREQWCGGSDHAWNPNRRDFLFVGALGALGMSLPNILRAEVGANMTQGKKI